MNTRLIRALSIVALTALEAGGFFACRRRSKRLQGYQNAAFYEVLYNPKGFELAIFWHRALGGVISRWVATLIGWGYAVSHPRVLEAIRDNIALIDKSMATRRNAIGLCIQQALNFREYAELWRIRRTPEKVLSKIGSRHGLEHIEAAYAKGKGCLLVTGHLGYFELGGLIMSQMGYPVVTLTLPEPSDTLTVWRADFRKIWGVETVVVGADAFSAVEITRALARGALVALLADRPFDGNTVPVELPYGRIPFSTSPVLVSLLSGAPIVPVGITREPDGRFRVEAAPQICPEWLPEGRPATFEKFTRELAESGLVPMFRNAPDQWHHYHRLTL